MDEGLGGSDNEITWMRRLEGACKPQFQGLPQWENPSLDSELGHCGLLVVAGPQSGSLQVCADERRTFG